jgi:GT2 family glycosyltransferase
MQAGNAQAKKPTVWIAVLHYQGAENTVSCLRSIEKLNYPHLRILITDNCSPDKSGEKVRENYPTHDYLQLADNLGFAGGSNAAINYCIQKGADWIWLLNNDTELAEDSLSKMMDIALSEERAGVLGARVCTPTTNGYHKSGRGEIDFFRGKTFERGDVDETQAKIACQWISGSNMLFRASAFQEMNGFDEKFFLYFEDTDICWRLNQAGWNCLLVPDAKIFHEGNASTQGKLAIWRSYYHTRNRLLFFLKNKTGIAALPILLAVSTHLIRHSIVLPFRGENGKRQLRAELLGFTDYLAGKLGKANCLDF